MSNSVRHPLARIVQRFVPEQILMTAEQLRLAEAREACPMEAVGTVSQRAGLGNRARGLLAMELRGSNFLTILRGRGHIVGAMMA